MHSGRRTRRGRSRGPLTRPVADVSLKSASSSCSCQTCRCDASSEPNLLPASSKSTSNSSRRKKPSANRSSIPPLRKRSCATFPVWPTIPARPMWTACGIGYVSSDGASITAENTCAACERKAYALLLLLSGSAAQKSKMESPPTLLQYGAGIHLWVSAQTWRRKDTVGNTRTIGCSLSAGRRQTRLTVNVLEVCMQPCFGGRRKGIRVPVSVSSSEWLRDSH